MKKSASYTAYICVISAAALWGITGVFFKLLSADGFTRIQTVFFRVTAAALGLLVYLLFTDRGALKIRPRDIWCFIGTGIVSLLFFNICYFSSIAEVGLPVAATLLYTAPAIVTVLSCFLFKEKITSGKIIALILTFAGCMLVTGLFDSSGALKPSGIIFGLLSGFGYALYSIFSRYALKRGYSSVTISLYTFLFASAGSVPAMLISGDSIPHISAVSAGCIAGMGILCCIFPYVLYTKGLSGMENSRASILATVEPLVAAVLGITLFGDRLTLTGAAGMALILSGIIIPNLIKSKPEKSQ